MLPQIIQRVTALVLPPTCVVCHSVLPYTEPIGICPTCYKDLPFWNKTTPPTPQLTKGVDSFIAPFTYQDPIKQLVTQLKFQDKPHLARVLTPFLNQNVPNTTNPLFVPVPVHRKRLQKRMYNQTALLTRYLAKSRNAQYSFTALNKTKDTPSQVGRTRAQRLKLPLKAFNANPKLVKDRNIILIDDLWTTGTTASVCAQALKKAGAKRVDVLCLCYVPL